MRKQRQQPKPPLVRKEYLGLRVPEPPYELVLPRNFYSDGAVPFGSRVIVRWGKA
jgi:hypothetical protein